MESKNEKSYLILVTETELHQLMRCTIHRSNSIRMFFQSPTRMIDITKLHYDKLQMELDINDNLINGPLVDPIPSKQ